MHFVALYNANNNAKIRDLKLHCVFYDMFENAFIQVIRKETG
jgi:hypothetical protein